MNKQPKTSLYGAYTKEMGIIKVSQYSNGYGNTFKSIYMVGIFNPLPVKRE